ncbi:MAG: PilW family protein [Pseudomonadota bacterium]
MRGFSLIELMVAVTISIVLMLGVTNIMISTKRAYYVQNDMGLLLENARFATEFLNNDLRMAGYFGCSGQTPTDVISLAGANNNGGSDVILVSFADANQNAFSVVHAPPTDLNASPLQQGETNFTVTTRGELFVGDTVIASDCGSSTSYTVNTVTDTTVTLNPGLDKIYGNGGQSHGAELRRLVTHRYFIATSTNGFSLFRDNGPIDDPLETSNAEELVEGVENMQIRYGEDTNDDGVIDQYLNSDNVTDMQNVVAIRITLLLNTITERYDREPDTETYALDPESSVYGPPDDYFRRAVFTTTVKLRNINNAL